MGCVFPITEFSKPDTDTLASLIGKDRLAGFHIHNLSFDGLFRAFSIVQLEKRA